MAVYSWIGYNEKGKETRGMIDASSPKEAKLKLRSQGVFVSAIAEGAQNVADTMNKEQAEAAATAEAEKKD